MLEGLLVTAVEAWKQAQGGRVCIYILHIPYPYPRKSTGHFSSDGQFADFIE